MKPPKNQSPQTKPNEDAVLRNLQPLDSVGKKDKTADTLRGDDEILKEALNCSTHTITKIKRAIALTRKDCEEEINLWKNRFKQAERLYQNLGEKSKQAERQRILEMIDMVDIELMLTDVKDKEGNIYNLSEEIMELISIWWQMKKGDITKEIMKDD